MTRTVTHVQTHIQLTQLHGEKVIQTDIYSLTTLIIATLAVTNLFKLK